jgi:RNA polymerase sigma-70 factor (ECF subfamily)
VAPQEAFFTQLIAEHQGIIHKVCNMYCDTQDDRRDMFQEIVLQLWRGYASFKHESKITTWMYRVALNTAITGLRKRKRRPDHIDLDGAIHVPQPQGNPDQPEETAMLYKAIAQLSEVERAITMLYLEEHSYDEIADIVGITANNVGVKINRIKAKLRKMLTPHL